MTNYASGHHAEQVAAEYLRQQGYSTVALNWKHARAEIDIVARKKRRFGSAPLVFFEVKHRKAAQQGTGLNYITQAKLRQMQFAAELYVTSTGYEGEYVLGAIELSGDYVVTACVENIILS